MYIFTNWLSILTEFELSDREHFKKLWVGYTPVNLKAIEEMWVLDKIKLSKGQ